jgi:hypothetical protein
MLEPCNKCKGLLSKWLIFLCQNLCPHPSTAANEPTRQLKLHFSHTPTHSKPSTNNYHMFEPLKRALSGQRFGSDDEINPLVPEFSFIF